MSEDELATKVKRWLNSAGAPLEMRAARVLLRRRLNVQQSEYYRDPDFDTLREIDIIANNEFPLQSGAVLASYLVIECKYAPTPWVIFRPPPAHEVAGPNFDRVGTAHGQEWLQELRNEEAVGRSPLIQQELRAGYAMTTSNLKSSDKSGSAPTKAKGGSDQVQESVKDLAYRASVTAVKAAEALAHSLDESDASSIAVFFPCIVLRGKLFETWLDEDDLEVAEVDRAQLLWKRTGSRRPILIDVVTESAFERFADAFVATTSLLFGRGRDHAERINITGIY